MSSRSSFSQLSHCNKRDWQCTHKSRLRLRLQAVESFDSVYLALKTIPGDADFPVQEQVVGSRLGIRNFQEKRGIISMPMIERIHLLLCVAATVNPPSRRSRIGSRQRVKVLLINRGSCRCQSGSYPPFSAVENSSEDFFSAVHLEVFASIFFSCCQVCCRCCSGG